MSFFRRLFGEKQDPLFDRAAELVEVAQINATAMFLPALERFSVLREVDTEHWDFVLTVAGVFIAATRDSRLANEGIIDKAKGCDIALATRMVSDAAADLYDACCLFTSDADYLPAVEAVRALGKVVWVFGYEDVLPVRSPYLYVPDRFVDLTLRFKDVKNNEGPQVKLAIDAFDS